MGRSRGHFIGHREARSPACEVAVAACSIRSKRPDVIDDSRSVVKRSKGNLLSCQEEAMAAQDRLSFWQGGRRAMSGEGMKGVVMAETVNLEIAQRLEEVAQLLDEQSANPYRVQAYRNAAQTLRRLDRPVAAIIQHEGLDGLRQLPGIGESLAHSIHALATTSRLPLLEQLRGESDPVALLASGPGIGEVLATRLHEDLGIHTLEELEAATYDGRLGAIAGFGKKKLEAIRDSLAAGVALVAGRPDTMLCDLWRLLHERRHRPQPCQFESAPALRLSR
jgi:predicted flap endonuclease-1-like 5' DNA nuclease